VTGRKIESAAVLSIFIKDSQVSATNKSTFLIFQAFPEDTN